MRLWTHKHWETGCRVCAPSNQPSVLGLQVHPRKEHAPTCIPPTTSLRLCIKGHVATANDRLVPKRHKHERTSSVFKSATANRRHVLRVQGFTQVFHLRIPQVVLHLLTERVCLGSWSRLQQAEDCHIHPRKALRNAATHRANQETENPKDCRTTVKSDSRHNYPTKITTSDRTSYKNITGIARVDARTLECLLLELRMFHCWRCCRDVAHKAHATRDLGIEVLWGTSL
eukprot:3252778-Amphidinium_carterae.1